MKISEIKKILPSLDKISFQFDNQAFVPNHFHLTEIGIVSKKFIDCGGTVCEDKKINFQLWHADDIEHRLNPSKMLKIIELFEKDLWQEDTEIEVEYQGNTIEKYSLEFKQGIFILVATQTNCLALDKCNLTPSQIDNTKKTTTCNPNSNCC